MRANPLPRAVFDQHPVAMRGQFMHALRRQADAIFVIFDLPDRAYNHVQPFRSGEMPHLDKVSPEMGRLFLNVGCGRPFAYPSGST